MQKQLSDHIAVIGLGYVGLPLAIHLAKYYEVTGFDIHSKRIESLKAGLDITEEVDNAQLKNTTITFTDKPEALKLANVYIIAVPTPITDTQKPDLSLLENACLLIGPYLQQNDLVVFESTVYPGVTEEFCGPLLEQASGLCSGKNFFLGYSPERINPGDKYHTINKITKVVSAQTEEMAHFLAKVYGKINDENIFIAKNIKTAEIAKVIENTQRDINIAFINETTMIAKKLGLSIYDILDAANTKWNFLDFKPGLVGGHCIGIDPYYMANCAQQLGVTPKSILAGREINEKMSQFIAEEIIALLNPTAQKNPLNVLVLGITFKENIPDLRNTKIVDCIKYLQNAKIMIEVHDPKACVEQAFQLYDLNLLNDLNMQHEFDAIIGAVAHEAYLNLTLENFRQLLKPKGFVIDLKNMWQSVFKETGEFTYWSL